MLSEETRDQIERRALEIAKIFEASSPRLEAEINQQHGPAWYVIVIHPGCEGLATRHLLRRCFGIFEPMFDEKVIVRGRVRLKRERLLPGYMLAFVWNINDQWSRVTTCPGVAGLLCEHGTGRAAVVPDILIEYLQGKEITTSLNNTQPGWAGIVEPTRKANRYKNRKNGSRVRGVNPTLPDPADQGPDVIIRCKSYLNGIEDLAAAERIRSFNKALGLGS